MSVRIKIGTQCHVLEESTLCEVTCFLVWCHFTGGGNTFWRMTMGICGYKKENGNTVEKFCMVKTCVGRSWNKLKVIRANTTN